MTNFRQHGQFLATLQAVKDRDPELKTFANPLDLHFDLIDENAERISDQSGLSPVQDSFTSLGSPHGISQRRTIREYVQGCPARRSRLPRRPCDLLEYRDFFLWDSDLHGPRNPSFPDD